MQGKFGRYSNIFSVFFSIVGVVVLAGLVQTGIKYIKSRGATTPIVKFEYASYTLPSSSAVRVMVDPGGNSIGFVKAEVVFDTTKVRLNQEIVTSTKLQKKITVTSIVDANTSGKIEIILGLDPANSATAPNSLFELAQLFFTPINTTSNQSSVLSFAPSIMQVVNTSFNSYVPQTVNTNLNINQTNLTPTPNLAITLTSPVNGNTYNGSMTASVAVTNNSGEPVQFIGYKIDNASITTTTAAPTSISINLSNLTNGQHSIFDYVATRQYIAKSQTVQYNVQGSLLNNTPTLTRTPTQPPLPTGIGINCGSLSGIERRFPCSPLVAGPMPANISSGTDAWDMFTSILYPGTIGDHFKAIANPTGSGVVVQNSNILSEAGDQHTVVGTGRSLPIGSTECSAFRWLWNNSGELAQSGWLLVWQLQMSGSPIVAIEVDSSDKWTFRTRNGGDTGLVIPLTPVVYGHWTYFVACTHLAEAPNGWTRVWFRNDGWPDVNAEPFYKRENHNTYQGQIGHNTIGIYTAHGGNSIVTGYFDRYGRAVTPQRAIQLAGNP